MKLLVQGNVWQCRIGPAPCAVPCGGDGLMRTAVDNAFREMFGMWATANFSGWGNLFREAEVAVIENRRPNPDLLMEPDEMMERIEALESENARLTARLHAVKSALLLP